MCARRQCHPARQIERSASNMQHKTIIITNCCDVIYLAVLGLMCHDSCVRSEIKNGVSRSSVCIMSPIHETPLLDIFLREYQINDVPSQDQGVINRRFYKQVRYEHTGPVQCRWHQSYCYAYSSEPDFVGKVFRSAAALRGNKSDNRTADEQFNYRNQRLVLCLHIVEFSLH